jgi:NTE family protein
MPKKTLVLTSGGILGVSYGGVFRCMEEKGIPLNDFEIVYGTSVGGMIGLLVVIGMSYLDIRRLLLNLPVQALFQLNTNSILRFADTYGLDDGTGLRKICRRVLRRVFGRDSITLGELYQRTSKVFAVNATNIQNGQSVILGTIETPNVAVEDAICATAAIPFLYTPVRLQGMTLVDGGVSESLLLKKVAVDDIPTTIAIVPLPKLEDMVVENVTDVAKSVYTTITNQSIQRLIDTCSKEACAQVIYIRTPVDPDAMLSERANSNTLRETLDFLGYTESNRSDVIERFIKTITTNNSNIIFGSNLGVKSIGVTSPTTPLSNSNSNSNQTQLTPGVDSGAGAEQQSAQSGLRRGNEVAEEGGDVGVNSNSNLGGSSIKSVPISNNFKYEPNIDIIPPRSPGLLSPADESVGVPLSSRQQLSDMIPPPPSGMNGDPSRSLPPPIKTRELAQNSSYPSNYQ